MKRNALIRIILFSSILLVLSSMLIFGIHRHYREYDEIIEVPIETVPTAVDATILHPRIATTELNVRNAPSQDATAIGLLLQNEWVDVIREETVNGANWSYITGPAEGWVLSEYLSPGFESTPTETFPKTNIPASADPETPAPIQETTASVLPSVGPDVRSFQPDKIHSLDIEWVCGNISILAVDTDTVLVSETGTFESRDAMTCQVKDGILSIDFSEDDDKFILFGTNFKEKDLTVCVPQNWVCRSLDIETASADVSIDALSVTKIDFEGASGVFRLNNCTVEQMDVDTASGDICFTGTVQSLDVEAASANVNAVLSCNPRHISVESMSGNLDLTLPEGTGFTLSQEGLSKNFTSEFDTRDHEGDQVCGDGSCRIRLNAVSGNVVIRKGPHHSDRNHH